MRILIAVIVAVLLFACSDEKYEAEQLVFDRISFVYQLKQTVDDQCWTTFNNQEFDVPLIYYTDSSSYIANPTEKFLKAVQSDLVFENKQLQIYRTAKRVDSLPFHMETGMNLGDPTDEYDYHSPFMKCSSYEEVIKVIPSVGSTEDWSTMIMHEYFHGFQYKHKPYMDYYEKNIAGFRPDSLNSIYQKYPWFKASIDKENNFLLHAISETDGVRTDQWVDSFFSFRNQRREVAVRLLQLNIAPFEKCIETMEGSARYIEFALYNIFSTRPSDEEFLKMDASFDSFEEFRNYSISNDPWLYETPKTTYNYAIGFNQARLLDKLKIPYKTRLFTEGGLSMEDLLWDWFKSKTWEPASR